MNRQGVFALPMSSGSHTLRDDFRKLFLCGAHSCGIIFIVLQILIRYFYAAVCQSGAVFKGIVETAGTVIAFKRYTG